MVCRSELREAYKNALEASLTEVKAAQVPHVAVEVLNEVRSILADDCTQSWGGKKGALVHDDEADSGQTVYDWLGLRADSYASGEHSI